MKCIDLSYVLHGACIHLINAGEILISLFYCRIIYLITVKWSYTYTILVFYRPKPPSLESISLAVNLAEVGEYNS